MVVDTVADVMIGALAKANDGLITRNADDFRALFPSLNIVTPKSPLCSS